MFGMLMKILNNTIINTSSIIISKDMHIIQVKVVFVVFEHFNCCFAKINQIEELQTI